MYILMTSKSYELYLYLFSYIKSLLLLNEIEVSFDNISFKTDFEKAERKAIITYFIQQKIFRI